MKKKVWISSPIYYVIAAVMLAIAGLSYFWNTYIFYIELFLTIIAIIIVIIGNIWFKVYVGTAVRAANKVLSGKEQKELQEFPIPVVVVGDCGDIIWRNDAFHTGVCKNKECCGENVLKFLYPHTLLEVSKELSADVTVENRQYTVYAAKMEENYILYFIDNTDYKEIRRQFKEKHPIVAMISFDNREELARDSNGNEDARIASEVEGVLRTWAQEMDGFLKRMSGGRFLLMTDETHVKAAAEKRFEVLDRIREIKAGDRGSATVSIGIGRGAPTLSEGERWARQALDMALGRGGDQVAIKQKNDSYEFFGGLSKGVEKRDKVRTRVIAATLSDHIKASDQVLVMGHKFSDLDCIGAAVGVHSAVTKGLKKPAFIVVRKAQSLAGPLIESMEKANPEEEIFISPEEAMQRLTSKTLLVVVDTHSQDFVESTDVLNKAERIVVIDHHRMMVKHIENAIIFYHEPYASSASEMVAELVQYIGENTLSRLEAEALLAGIMLDTKNFVLKTGVRTFEASAYLRRRGADTVEVKRMFSNSLDTYKAKYQLVSDAEIYNNCAIACAEENLPDIRIASAQAADELLSIQGVNASFVMFPTGDCINISARSLGDINVQLIMEAMGGGGHLTMAGAQIKGISMMQARDRLISVLNDTLPQVSRTMLPGKEKE